MTAFAMPQPHPVMNLLLAVAASSKATVELTADTLTVRLGISWRADADGPERVERGEWLVNTSTKGLVVLTIDPEGRGRCLGYPIKLRRLHLSLADPDAFLAELGVAAP